MPQGGGRSQPSQATIIAYAKQVAAHWNVPWQVVVAVIQSESSFRVDVVSRTGAIGLMQLEPGTARSLGVNPWDWQENINGGVHYLATMYRQFGSWQKADAAYGWGPGNWQGGMQHAGYVMGIAKQQYGWGGQGGGGGGPSVWKFIDVAKAQIGDPYVWGHEGPNAFDCSGLVYFALRQAGVDVPRLTAEGYYQRFTNRVGKSDLRPGDILFYHEGRLGPGQADHVNIYIGGGMVVSADHPGAPVRIEHIDWAHFIGAAAPPGLSLGGKEGSFMKGDQSQDPATLAAALKASGIDPAKYGGLINQAILNGWTPEQFLIMVEASPQFAAQFPGIFMPGGGLKMAPGAYLQQAQEFRNVAANYGIKLDAQRIGILFGGDVTTDEFKARSQVFKAATLSDDVGMRDAFNATLRERGIKPMDQKGWYDFLYGKPAGEVYDIYYEASLKNAGLNIGKGVAGQIGQPGTLLDVTKLVQQVKQVKQFITPDLRAAGISDADLAIMESGNDPKNQQNQLQQILRNRGAIQGGESRPAGVQVPEGQAGIFPALSGQGQ